LKASFKALGKNQLTRGNAEKLLKDYPDIADIGFYIVTTTYSTKEVHINAWTRKEDKVILGFKAGVTPVGEIAPTTQCYRAQCASDGNSPDCKG
jgi:hypothetical protein